AQSAALRPAIAVDAVFIDVVAQVDHRVHRLFQIGDGAIGVEIAEAVVRTGHHRQPRPLRLPARQGAGAPDGRDGVGAVEAIHVFTSGAQTRYIDLGRVVARGRSLNRSGLDDAGETFVLGDF